MIEKDRHIKELWDLNHRNDSTLHTGFDYQNKMYSKILSNIMFSNENTTEFLNKIQKLSVWQNESVLVFRNFFNYTIDKNSDQHNN